MGSHDIQRIGDACDRPEDHEEGWFDIQEDQPLLPDVSTSPESSSCTSDILGRRCNPQQYTWPIRDCKPIPYPQLSSRSQLFRCTSQRQRWLRTTCQTRCLAHQLPLYRKKQLYLEHLCSTRSSQHCSWMIFLICSLIQRSQLLHLPHLASACILLSRGRGRCPQTENSQCLPPTPTAPVRCRDEEGAAQPTKDHLGHSCEHGACGA